MTKEEFSKLVLRALDVKAYENERALGQVFTIDVGTVNRWKTATSSPHPYLRDQVAEAITEAIKETGNQP